jgi:hypothetical protein
MALLVPKAIANTGTVPTYTTANASETVYPDDRVALHVKNASGGSINVTTVIPGSRYGQANPDIVTAVAAGTDKFIKIPTGESADPVTGLVAVTYSATTSVTAALLRI